MADADQNQNTNPNTKTDADDSPPRRRGRARSKNVSTNPLACPLNAEEEKLAILVRQINQVDAAIEKDRHVREAQVQAQAQARSDSAASQSPRPDAPFATSSSSARVKASSPKSQQAVVPPNMNYQNYIDSPGGSGSNPRQAPPSPSQGMPNGMNGGMGLGGGMVGYPTPAGHQSDLNYVMSMVEELSSVLKANAALTAGVVDKMGKVRLKAQHLNLTNDELVAVVASELNEDSKNLEKENSELRKALELSDYDKKENYKLAIHGANILADITEKMHRYKEQHEVDTLAWHTNYRQQLEHEREENLKLRCQIDDMKAAACRANGHIRDMRRYLTDHDELNELRIQNTQYRQERRFWKRKALPLIPDNDPEWSDDDDLIDPEEKKRLAATAAEKDRKDKDAEGGDEGQGAIATA